MGRPRLEYYPQMMKDMGFGIELNWSEYSCVKPVLILHVDDDYDDDDYD